jgi:glycolate oxidase FAD binding subunit
MAHSTNLQTFADELAAITGPEHLRIEDGVYTIAPANTEEIAAILRHANQNNITIALYGGGTKQSWDNPIQPALIVHTNRLNSIREHTWQDMTCTVEAGCTWSSMQSVLAQHAQFVALDPLWPDRATIGGIAATNDSGSLRLRYGSLRDLIIGMTIVLADGTIARSGGKVVKNVAGYDLHKLMTGAFGTLGIITEITFRLHSIPKHAQTFTISSPDAEPLGQLLLKILDSHLSTQSLQLRSTATGFELNVRLATLPEVIHTQTFSLTALSQSLHLSVAEQDPNIWIARQQLFDDPASFLIKATMLPTDIPRIAAIIHDLGGASVTQATGIMATSVPASAFSQLTSLREQLEAIHGSLTILHTPENATPVASSSPTDTLPLMRELKQRFDPNRILNPGRFLGGI